MNQTSAFTFFTRLRKVCAFDGNIYQDTRNSFLSAAVVVLLVALSHGIGAAIRAGINNWDPGRSFVFGLQGEIVFWLAQSLVYFLVARAMLRKTVKFTELLSAIGFGIFPGILVFAAAVLQLIDLSVPMLIVLAAYRLATCTAALQQVLQLQLLQAILLALAGTVIGFFCMGAGIRLAEVVLQ